MPRDLGACRRVAQELAGKHAGVGINYADGSLKTGLDRTSLQVSSLSLASLDKIVLHASHLQRCMCNAISLACARQALDPRRVDQEGVTAPSMRGTRLDIAAQRVA